MKKIVLVAFVLVLLSTAVVVGLIRPVIADGTNNISAFSMKTSVAQSEAVIYVSPDMSIWAPGASFNITVDIKHAENVYSWQFKLSWDPAVLELQQAQEGDFLNQRIYKTQFQEYVYNDAGNVTVVCFFLGEPRASSASGDGTLATVTFYVKDDGYTALPLYNTQLLDYDMLKLPHTSEDGYFQCGDHIVVDQSFVSDERADVSSVQTIGFHAKWGLNGSDVVGGSIFVNGTKYVTNGTGWINVDISSPMVGQEEWVVTKVNCSSVTMYVQEVSNPSIVWDQIEIVDGGSTRQSVTLGEMTIIWFQATYEYDDVVFDDTKGILYVNEAEMTWSTPNDRWEYNYSVAFFGSIAFTITGVSDNLYGLTEINDPVGAQTIIQLEQPNLNITLDCLTSYLGYKVKISGRLAHINGTGIAGANLLLTYSVTSGESWNDITLVTTMFDGDYYAEWMPTATGNYLIRVVWKEDEIPFLLGTEVRVTLAVTPLEEKHVFSVVSNSTISDLAFNTTDWTLSFTATGPNSTRGYVKITVAKSLVENITNIRVYLDGNQTEYLIASIDNSWLLTFSYMHSNHQIAVDLDINTVPEFPTWPSLLLLFIVTVVAIAIYKRRLLKTPIH
jgi:hypothetical protein